LADKQQNSVDIENWLKLIHADGVGPVTFAKLIKYFGSVDRSLCASINELAKINGIGLKTAEQIARTRDEFNTAAELELADKLGVWLINIDDPRYPAVLKRIYDPPPILYIKGTLTKSDNLAAAIVGARRCSLYGQEQASRIAHLLAAAGFTICSGMARGIDTAAHQGALASGGRTIAVQGCGLANIFPPENKKLFELISNSGAVVSELPLRCEPLAENFPSRNRIIAGLSLATIVIEAGLNSGSLITAKIAMENNREVMAVPGKIDSPLSKGSNRLIKDGAKLVDSIEDIMEGLGYIGIQLQDHASEATAKAINKLETPTMDINQLKLTDSEKTVHSCINKEPLHIEQIVTQTSLQPGIINSCLISLQLKGLVKQLQGSMFIRN